MTKILFIIPPNISFDDFMHPPQNARHVMKADGKFYGSLATNMPIGSLSLSAYLKKHARVEVKLVDFNIELSLADTFPHDNFHDYFLGYLQKIDWSPDIIGISTLFSPAYFSLLDLGKVCRTVFPSALVLAGGNVPSNLYREIYADARGACFDALCYGEGEKPLLDLVLAEDRQKYIQESASFITMDKVAARQMFSHNFIEDLDEIPFYDYGLCDETKYGLNPATTAYASLDERRNQFHVMTSRGCPFRCTFCASHKVHGRDMRYYSLERVRQDFLRLRDEHGAGTFVFQDDHFMGDRDRAYAIIKMVGEMGVKAVFQNGLALYALDRPMLEALHAAGVRQLVLPVESGSERVLKEVMRKPLKLAIARRVATDCRELGIYTNTNILVGLPGEKKEDIDEAREFLKTIGVNWFQIVCAAPLVGSEMHEICVEKNYLKNDYLGADFRTAVIETEDFTSEYIQEIAYTMNLELNFVANADFRLGHYDVALKGFENAIRARSDHVFAHHYASLCHEKLGNAAKSAEHREIAARSADNPFWQKYMRKLDFSLDRH